MILEPALPIERDELTYARAIARLKKELGLSEHRAHAAIAEIARAYGVFLDDVAGAILKARTLKRGLAHALRSVQWDRRPLQT